MPFINISRSSILSVIAPLSKALISEASVVLFRMAARIGNSFSLHDIEIAIKHNVREIRAVTPTYTYSISRPSRGWGITADKVESARIIQNLMVEVIVPFHITGVIQHRKGMREQM